MLGAVLHILALVALSASWSLSGYGLLPARLRREAPLQIWSTALALGAGLTALALTALAALHVLGTGTTIGVASTIALTSIRGARAASRDLRTKSWRPSGRLEWAVVGAVAAVLLASLVATLAPPSSMDATVYHLRVPREFLRTGGWGALEDSHSFQPLYVEMLFGEGLVLGGGVVAALIHWALGLGAIAAAGAWGCRLGGGALWPIAIFGTSALYVWESTSAFIDLGLALFSSLSLLWATRSEEDLAPALLAGLFGGLAAGSKFTGLISAALAALAAFATVLPDWRRALRRALCVGGLSLLVALPWYVRNVMFRGNPIYPIANPLFGLPPVAPELSFFAMTYGVGRDVLHLLTSPFDLLSRGETFDQGWSIGPAYLALAPVGLLVSREFRAKWIVAVAIALWWIIWFYTSPQTRLLMPVLPLAAGLAGVGMQAAFRSTSRLLRLAALASVAATAIGGLASGALFVALSAKVVLGLETPADFLSRNSWHYVAYQNANRILPPDAHVAVVGGNNLFYLEPRAEAFLDRQPSPRELAVAGYTHQLTMQDCPTPPPPPSARVLWEGVYPLRLSRLRGGVRKQACGRLEALPPAP